MLPELNYFNPASPASVNYSVLYNLLNTLYLGVLSIISNSTKFLEALLMILTSIFTKPSIKVLFSLCLVLN